jgi:hypothetical protein
VLDGPLVIGARLLEHLVEEVGTSGGFPRVLVLFFPFFLAPR